MKSTTSKFLFLSVLASALLAACGGGGGGSTPGTSVSGSTTVVTPTPSPVPVIQPANLVLTSPPTTYVAGSEELSSFNTFNNARISCGFGALTQNAALDKSAAGHALWSLGISTTSHIQTVGSPNFTGVNPEDRDISAGYASKGSFEYGEDIASRIYSEKTGYGDRLAKGLLNAPYHLNSMMNGYRDVGTALSVSKGVNGFGDRTTLVFDAGYQKVVGEQLLAADSVQTYPCDGTTDVNISQFSELPNPVPGRDLDAFPIGMSIYIGLRSGNSITITSASVTNLATGNPEKVNAALTAKTDPNITTNGSHFGSHQAVIFTDKPASPNTKYAAVISGTNNGVSLTRNFTFTTGTVGIDGK